MRHAVTTSDGELYIVALDTQEMFTQLGDYSPKGAFSLIELDFVDMLITPEISDLVVPPFRVEGDTEAAIKELDLEIVKTDSAPFSQRVMATPVRKANRKLPFAANIEASKLSEDIRDKLCDLNERLAETNANYADHKIDWDDACKLAATVSEFCDIHDLNVNSIFAEYPLFSEGVDGLRITATSIINSNIIGADPAPVDVSYPVTETGTVPFMIDLAISNLDEQGRGIANIIVANIIAVDRSDTAAIADIRKELEDFCESYGVDTTTFEEEYPFVFGTPVAAAPVVVNEAEYDEENPENSEAKTNYDASGTIRIGKDGQVSGASFVVKRSKFLPYRITFTGVDDVDDFLRRKIGIEYDNIMSIVGNEAMVRMQGFRIEQIEEILTRNGGSAEITPLSEDTEAWAISGFDQETFYAAELMNLTPLDVISAISGNLGDFVANREFPDRCWFVYLTSEEAQNILDMGIEGTIVEINRLGRKAGTTDQSEYIEEGEIAKPLTKAPRPWTVSDQDREQMTDAEIAALTIGVTADEYYFVVAPDTYETLSRSTIYVTPRAWFKEHGTFFTGEMPLEFTERNVRMIKDEKYSYRFSVNLNMAEATMVFIDMGFRESLEYQLMFNCSDHV